jgi:hypothetical protein
MHPDRLPARGQGGNILSEVHVKKIIAFILFLAFSMGLTACVSTNKTPAYTPPVVKEKTAGPEAIPLDEPVTGTSVNTLADTLGPVIITVDKDTSYVSNDPLQGGAMRMVKYLGKEALEVTANKYNEIRVAFVPDKPVSLKGYSTLSFSVAGFEGWDGIYNCGLLYTDAKSSGERLGSFYVSRISPKEWVSVKANLVKNEVWEKNFSESRVLYCIQFWTNQAKKIYIADVSLQ